MHDIAFDDVSCVFDDGTVALDHMSLTIRAGEMFGVVGPSGCGKTTALRVLAGLQSPTGGRVRIGGRDVTDVPTRERNLGLITQNNHLLRHMSAGDNIKFPLSLRKKRAHHEEEAEQVEFEASGLGIGHLLDRAPRTLSEGERRTVQLARAVIRAPETLLMDEPFAFLEDQLRLRLRGDVVRVHAARGLTSMLVTASQDDAMAMCDRIVVLFGGAVHQVAPPRQVYLRPATAEVGAFFGEPSMNVVTARVRVEGTERYVEVLGRPVRVWSPLVDAYAGSTVLVGFRAEDLEVGDSAAEAIEVRVLTTEPLGYQTLATAAAHDGTSINCALPGRPPPIGTVLDLGVRGDRLHVFDPATGMAILHPVD